MSVLAFLAFLHRSIATMIMGTSPAVPALSPDQIVSFKREGYLILRAEEHGLVDPRHLKQWTDDILKWQSEGECTSYDEINTKGERQIMRTERITDLHPQLEKLLRRNAIYSLIKQLTGKDAVLFKDKINYKMPSGSGFEAHIDAPSYTHVSGTEFIEIMVAVEAQTLQNGCVEVLPGSHKRRIPTDTSGRVNSLWESINDFIPILLNPGDMLIFGSLLAHRSGPNLTQQRRAVVIGTYHFDLDRPDLRVRYYAYQRSFSPPDHVREREKRSVYQGDYAPFAYPGSISWGNEFVS